MGNVLVMGVQDALNRHVVLQLINQNHKVKIAAIDRNTNSWQSYTGVEVIDVGLNGLKYFHFLDVDVVVDVLPLQSLINEQAFDIIISHFHTQIATLAKIMGVSQYILLSSTEILSQFKYEDRNDSVNLQKVVWDSVTDIERTITFLENPKFKTTIVHGEHPFSRNKQVPIVKYE